MEKNMPSLEVAGEVLVKCNLVNYQYQQKSEVVYTLCQRNFILIS